MSQRPSPPDASPDSTSELAPAAVTQLIAVVETASDAFYAVDDDWRVTMVNAAAEKYFGVPRERILHHLLWEVFPQGRGTDFEKACRRAMESGTPTVLEGRSTVRPDRYIELKVIPTVSGGAGVWVADITDRRGAEEALRAERDRSREVLESISDAFYAIDHEWRFTYINRIAEEWWGRRREDLIGQVFWEAFPQALGSRSAEAHHRAMGERTVVRLETVSPVIGRWIDLSIFPSGTGLSVYFRDITERKHAEERQRLLVNELNHRVKNSLAVVQAIARQTLRHDREIDEAREAFTERLLALARAHDVLTQEQLVGADLQEVVARAVLAQLDRPDHVELQGPAVAVPPNTVVSLSLALHELATNALKYGALSVPAGRVSLNWRLVGQGASRRLLLRWAERGGPPVSPPASRGFGSRLIEQALGPDLGGEVRLAFESSGVVCEIEAPAPFGDRRSELD